MTIAVVELLKKAKVRMILLDEFQHFLNQRGDINYEMADYFKVLSDATGVNLLFAGLPEASIVVTANEQLACRAQVPCILPRFEWEDDRSKAEFIYIVNAYSDALHPISSPNFDDADWAFRWMAATGGRIGLVSKIFGQVLQLCMKNSLHSIGMEHLDQAHRTVILATTPELLDFRPFSRDFKCVASPENLSLIEMVGSRNAGFDGALLLKRRRSRMH